MKPNSPIYLIFLFFLFNTSCNAPSKIDSPRVASPRVTTPKESTIIQPKTKLPDHDPYFVGNEKITSPFGPSTIIRNIIQDRKGNIWLATWDGIIQYDGKTFTNFTNKEGLRRFRCFSLIEDSKGILWFGTIGAGVYRYDGKTFTNFTTKEGLVHNGIGCIYEDKTGNIWFGTQRGVSKYDGKTFTNFTTNEGLTDNDINSIIEDQNGRLWFGTRGDACYYDSSFPNSSIKTFHNFKNKDGNSFANVRTIIEDRKGNIWLAGQEGLWCYNNSPISIPTKFTQVTTDFVGYIYEDKNGNLWTSSATNGNAGNWKLLRYDSFNLEINSIIPPTQIKAESGMYFGILEDKDGGIWWGTLNGAYHYDGNSFNNFKEKN